MRKLLLILLVISFSTTLLAQFPEIRKPDMDKIKSEIRDSRSNYYYPYLMKRFVRNDTTLTLDEYRYLYLGFSFQEGYNPYRVSPYSEVLKDLYSLQKHSPSECDSILKYAKLSIADFPFDLRQINLMIYAYQEKGLHNEAAKWEFKLRSIIDAILSTGDGKTPETGWYVIYPTHEYDIINKLGFTAVEHSFTEPSYDYIRVEKNRQKAEGYYFNAYRMLTEYDRKF